ncbi:hypothetical protein G7Y79_00030g064740 [Physcia stellaris]|nr:hypothetical protein G7Y79_00030g064740 [Physcia stellaris]
MIVLIVLAIALVIAIRVQKRKDVQITPTRCDRPDLHQRESFGRQVEESRLLSGKNSVRQPKPYLLFLPAELKAMILRNLTSFQDLKSLTQAIATYHVIADRDNIFTEATMNGLESRDVSFLPRDVALPELRTVGGLSVLVRVPGLAPNCQQLELLQAFEAYMKVHTMNGIRFRLTFEQCLALQSVLDVEDWWFNVNAKPGPLAKDVDNPREEVTHCIDHVFDANNLEFNSERNIDHKDIWLLAVEKKKKNRLLRWVTFITFTYLANRADPPRETFVKLG